MTTLLLADDHALVRQGLRMLLESEPDLQVVGEAGDGSEALRLAEGLRPDILIVDVMMPGLSGLEVAQQVRRRWPKVKVIVLSMYDSEAYVVEALQAGASAYVLKKATSSDLVHAVRRVIEGGLYLSPPLDERAIQAYTQKAQATRLDLYESLTAREREVLGMAAEGLSAPQIAGRLSLSPRTAEMHRANLMKKLSLKSQTELIRYALKRGLLAE
ncbi:MAG: signal transduction response regulator LuxR family [Anaerolineaceae bacterium]|nr:MAG: signal transduction response regulator LuxR family [Anaerolineaceae bacterium]